MKVYYDSNKGLLRENNEDSLVVLETKRYSLFAVADGMGGHRAGEIASSMAIDTIKECFEMYSEQDDFKAPMFIDKSIKDANKRIKESAMDNEERSGMGTTVTIAVIDLLSDTVYVGNVGDSRAYIIRNGRIRQITVDHTYVNELVKDGKLTLAEAKKHPKKNIITRAVGSEDDVLVDIFEIELLEGDILLLCSDGLTTHLSDEDILFTINNCDCSECVQKLIKFSNDNGGSDNITLIIVDNNFRGDIYDR